MTWSVHTGFVGRKDPLAQRVDLAAVSVRNAQMQAVGVLGPALVLRARPDDCCLELIVQASIKSEVRLVTAATPRKAHIGGVAPALEQLRAHKDQRVDGHSTPAVPHRRELVGVSKSHDSTAPQAEVVQHGYECQGQH